MRCPTRTGSDDRGLGCPGAREGLHEQTLDLDRHPGAAEPGRTAWALLHTIRRHGGRVEDVVVIELDVPRAWLRRNRRQLWYSVRDIPPVRFTRVIDFAEVAGSSADLVA